MVWFASKSYIAHLVCLIVYYYYYKMRCKRKMSCSMSSKREMSSTASSCRESLSWTRSMDDALIDAFMHEYNNGHKVNGTFTSIAYDNIVQEVSLMFDKKIDKEKVKNRWKTLKKHFTEVYGIFKNGSSGFVWNPSTHLWDAEPEVWDALIESKPKAANWRNTPLPNYERMMILYGNDRATREEPETASEIRKRRHSATEEEFTTTIDKLFSQNEVTLENADAFIDIDNDNVSNLSAQHPSPGGNIGTNKKKKKEVTTKEKDNEFEVIKGAISEVAAALREGNAILRDICNYKLPPISGEETWNLIKECGCDVNLLPKIYCFLMSDVGKLRTVLQCPAEARKAVIMQMVFGFSYSPS